ncbi:MAG: cytochrome c class I [Chitinophagaceae bacterium]|nr:cytochrome c class I [Chitinophagaceae bacterium]
MKKILITSAVVLTFVACGGSGTENKEAAEQKSATSEAAEATSPTDNPDYEKGLVLVAKPENLCLTCHKIDEKVIGPAYRDVANKYEATEANIKMLAEKVVKGGSGVWGDVAMPPNAVVNIADAEQMVKYILLLKNK